jgi:uncharacterized membrane protein YhaH (DUF805 family)
MEWMLMPLRRYADFSGRSRRREFWMWNLLKFLVACVIGILFFAFAGTALMSGDPKQMLAVMLSVLFLWLLCVVLWLAILVPDLAVTVRRLHDTDRSGWWVLAPWGPYLLGMVALSIGGGINGPMNGEPGTPLMVGGLIAAGLMLVSVCIALVLLVFMFLDGTPGPNRFGPDPKGNMGQVFS